MNEFSSLEVTGTLIWYYFICKREVWLMSRNIVPDQENPFIEIGRLIQETTYEKEKKEIDLGNIKIDKIRIEEDEIIIGEVKKSSKFKESAKMQLLFYLKELHERGINAKGELNFPKEKKKEKVVMTKVKMKELEEVEESIKEIAGLNFPPKPVKINYCKNCGYNEFCWS